MLNRNVRNSQALQQGRTGYYWKSVQHCIAHPDGSVEIHHHYGLPEVIGKGGELIRTRIRKEPQTGSPEDTKPTIRARPKRVGWLLDRYSFA